MNELETGYLKNIEGLVEYSSVIRYDPIKMWTYMYSFKKQILVELHYRNVNIGISKESNYKVNKHFNYLFL